MSELRDINSFFFRKKKKPTDDEKPKKRTTGVDESQPTKKEPAPAEVRFVSAKFEPHSVYGYTPNKEAVISGSIEFIRKTKLTKLTLELFAIYNNKEENLQIKVNKYGTTEIDTNKKFKFSGVPLYYHNNYPTTNNKELFNDTVTYKAVISHKHHEKPLEITVKFPDANAKPVDLKKGMYDTKAHNAKPGKFPADPAQGYIEGTKVFDLQQMLEALNYLPKGSADGAFGDKTEEAVKAFQGDSLKKVRQLKTTSKLKHAGSITYKGQASGVVDSVTRDEFQVWKRDNFLRPIVSVFHEDYDGEAVNKGIKPGKEDNHHEIETPVLKIQKMLKDVGAYDGTLDGWYGDKTKAAFERFIEAAKIGKFIINGKETELEEKYEPNK